MTQAGPIVKWVGGKTKLLAELKARLPRTFDRYYEPFVGGGALFFSLDPPLAILSDTNDALMGTYRAIATNVEDVISLLGEHKSAHSVDGYYYAVRDAWNSEVWCNDGVATAAAFIYLNKTCFNGLWRVNRSGKFNVPRGDYKNPAILDAPGLRAAALVLAKTELLTGDYVATTANATDGDLVYFDPPYDPVSKTSNFTSYTKDAFGKHQQAELAAHARVLANRGVHVMLSNNDTPYVRSLYSDFHLSTVKCGRSINSKGGKRGAVDELIITSYPVHATYREEIATCAEAVQ
jgi:DNA adenine methylase